MRGARQKTFQESGITIMPLAGLSHHKNTCVKHNYERRTDKYGHVFHQCMGCQKLEESFEIK